MSMRIYILTMLLLLALPAAGLRAATGTTYEVDPDSSFVGSGHEVSGSSYSVSGSVGGMTVGTSGSTYILEAGAAMGGACGDGFVDPSEDCDGSDLDGGSCSSEGFDSGSLSCGSSCSYDTSSCENDGGGGGGGGGGGRSGGVPGGPPAGESEESSDGSGSAGSSDLNGDSEIDDYDLSLLVRAFGTGDIAADLNGDGTVDDYDFSIFVSRWNESN
jgi:hypothetical protein